MQGVQIASFHFFEFLGEFASDTGQALSAQHGRQFGEQFYDSVRTFEKNECARFVLQGFQTGLTSLFGGKEAFEDKPVARHSARHQGCERRRRTRNRADRVSRLMCRACGQKSRIGNTGRARIRDQGHIQPFIEFADHIPDLVVLIMEMETRHRRFDAELMKQKTGSAGIFTKQMRDGAGHFDGSGRPV